MDEKYTVALIGCGRLGQHYAEVYQTLPNTELVAIAEYNPERRQAVGERFGVRALYQDAQDLFRHMVPDIAAVVLPGKYIKEAVIAAAQAGVKGVSTDKPIEARLSDVDAMIEECTARGVVFAGGNLQRGHGRGARSSLLAVRGRVRPIARSQRPRLGPRDFRRGLPAHRRPAAPHPSRDYPSYRLGYAAGGPRTRRRRRVNHQRAIFAQQRSRLPGFWPTDAQLRRRSVDRRRARALGLGAARNFPRPRGFPYKDRPPLYSPRLPPLFLHGHLGAVVFRCRKKRRRVVQSLATTCANRSK